MKTQLTLQEFIFLIGRCPPDAEVYFDFCDMRPTQFKSYRSDYSELALGYFDSDGNSVPEEKKLTVSKLKQMAENEIGRVHQGYKGGDFTMHDQTPLWVSNWGRSSGTAIIGIIDEQWRIVIETQHLDR